MPPISREQAQAIAEAYLTAHPAMECSGIREVYAVEEITWRVPCLGHFSPEGMEGYWIAYATCPGNAGWVCASTVVLVSMETGSVDFAGCANDEG